MNNDDDVASAEETCTPEKSEAGIFIANGLINKTFYEKVQVGGNRDIFPQTDDDKNTEKRYATDEAQLKSENV